MVIAFYFDVTSWNLVDSYGSFPQECAEFISNIKLQYCTDTLLQSYQAMQPYSPSETNFSNLHSKYFNPQLSVSLRLFFSRIASPNLSSAKRNPLFGTWYSHYVTLDSFTQYRFSMTVLLNVTNQKTWILNPVKQYIIQLMHKYIIHGYN